MRKYAFSRSKPKQNLLDQSFGAVHGSLLIGYEIMAGGEPFKIGDLAIQFRRHEPPRHAIDQGCSAWGLDRQQQTFRHRLIQEMIDVGDVLAEEAIKFGVIFRRMVIAEPPNQSLPSAIWISSTPFEWRRPFAVR